MSTEKCNKLLGGQDGKGINWTTNIRDELPVKMRDGGDGSEAPMTICQLFLSAVALGEDRKSLMVQRDGKEISWTWKDYYKSVMDFAKSLHHLKCTEKTAVAIMGFNSPEWVICSMGAIMNNNTFTGVYITNQADACLYQTNHSDAEVVCVDTIDNLKKFLKNREKMPQVKAFIVWGDQSLPKELEGDKSIFLWRDFLTLGKDVEDQAIHTRMEK